MINDLIPWVGSHFGTLTDKDHRGMAGLSMGGGMTASVTMANLDKFSYIGLFSGGGAVGAAARRRQQHPRQWQTWRRSLYTFAQLLFN